MLDLETRCLTLDERLGDNYEPLDVQDAGADARLDLWMKIACGGQTDIFNLRLQRDGLSEIEVRRRLGAVRRRSGRAAPIWLGDAAAVLADISKHGPANADPILQTTPFGPLLSSLVQIACEHLTEVAPAWSSRLSEPARVSATRQLWQSLSDLFGLPLQEALAEWREGPYGKDASDFSEFAEHMRANGFNDLFERYPVLARLGGILRRRWIESYGLFLRRLERDFCELGDTFIGGEFKVDEIRYGLSDPHGAGDAVLELTLRGGQRVFYKPRSLATDALVRDVAGLFMQLEPELGLQVPRFIDRGDYGWVEAVQLRTCTSIGEVRQYFRRAGGWLGCFHLLNATDMHMENVIASGAHPIPIDFETILQAEATRPKILAPGEGAYWCASRQLEESVLSVGLLPGYMRTENGGAVSVGGLEASHFEVNRLVWSNVNTTSMSVNLHQDAMLVDSNLPSLKHERVSIDAFRADVVEGLACVLQSARDNRASVELLLRDVAGAQLKVRRVVRPTRFYYLLLRRMTDHRTMGDGVTWGLQSELIARLYDWDDMDTQPWKLFRAERDALYRLTIPAFYLDADRTVAEDWNGQITNLHARDGLSVALDRLAKLDEAEAERQCSFAAVALGHQRPARTRPPAQAAADDFVLELVEHLRERAIFEAGSAAWLGLEYTDHRLMSQVVPIGYDLYNGALGVAVFLSAAARVRGYAGAFDLAKQALAPINGGLQSRNKHRLARSIGIGGFLGLGSLAYGLTVCAQLLEDDECLAGAHMAASLIDANAIGADNRYDLIGGSAGAILGIMKLHEATQSPELLRQAVSIADVLLSRPRNKGEPWASKLFDLQALTGVSHGASGFALAFARLHKGTGDQRYAAVVDDCLAFERAAFDATAGNWRDTRPSAMRGASSSPNQWCYGAAGIGYARLGLRALKNTAEDSTAKSLDAAIASVLALRTPSSDTLCCGAAGHADFLTAAATALDRPDLLAASQAIIADMSQRWRQTGDARWDLGGKDFNLGLMRGVAGLGYAALRSESPKLPQILILQ